MDDIATPEPPRRKRSRWLMALYWVCAIAGTVIGAGWYTQSSLINSDVDALLVSGTDRDLSAIEVHYPDGSSKTLAEFHGRYLLIDFWASWCPYCRISMPTYEALQHKYPDKLTLLAINTGESLADAQAWLKDQGLKLPLLRSPALEARLDVKVLPTTVLLDPKGKRVWATVGYVPVVTPALLEREIKQ